MNIYVGNLSWSMTDDDLSNLFTSMVLLQVQKFLKKKTPAVVKVSVLLKWKTMKQLKLLSLH